MIQGIVKYLQTSVRNMNEKGIPIPLGRLKGRADLVGTMTVVSFGIAAGGTVGKITKFIGEVDLTQAIVLFGICLSAYLGNKKMTIGDKSVSSEPGETKGDTSGTKSEN